MGIFESVLHDGDPVRAYGRIVVDGAAVWFEPPLPEPLILHPPGQAPAPRPSGFGVPTAGVDLAATDGGWATLSGTWQGDGLVVSEQEPQRRGTREDAPQWDQPPCPPPAGGWPEGAVDEVVDLPPDLMSSYGVAAVTWCRPSPGQTVLVVAAEEPGRVEAALRPRYGDHLCVVHSRWARRQVDDVLHQLRAGTRPWLVYESGETATADGQVLVTARVTRVLPAFAGWVAGVPDGLLSVSPWLAPGQRPG